MSEEKEKTICKPEKDSKEESSPTSQTSIKTVCKACGHDNTHHSELRCDAIKDNGKKCNMLLSGRGALNQSSESRRTWKTARKDLIKALHSNDVIKIAEIMIEFADDAKDARLAIKEVAPYLMSRKSTQKDDTVKDSTLNITFVNADAVQAEFDKAALAQEQIDQETS